MNNMALFPTYRDDGEFVEATAEDMRFLRNFPAHMQGREIRDRIERIRAGAPGLDPRPDIFFLALLIVCKEFAAEDDLVEHPENCPRCNGSGSILWQGKNRYCGCPAGNKRMIGKTTLTTRQLIEPIGDRDRRAASSTAAEPEQLHLLVPAVSVTPSNEEYVELDPILEHLRAHGNFPGIDPRRERRRGLSSPAYPSSAAV